MRFGKRQVALMLGTPVLSVALLGGAAAAFQPVDGQAVAHRESAEKTKPPVPKLEEILDQLVQAGKITATQREAILAAVKQFTDKVEEKRPEKPEPKVAPKDRAPKVEGEDKKKEEAKKKDRGAKDERKAEQKVRIDVHRLLGDSLRSAVAYLGLETRAVQEQLRAGKSLAEIAAANGRTREGLIDAIRAPAGERIDELKSTGKLTIEQAAKTREQVTQAAAKIVDTKASIRKVTPPGQAKKRG